MNVFDERAEFTHRKLTELETQLLAELANDKDRILRSDTAIYITGSGGRDEMSQHSDVDLFIARTTNRLSPVDSFQFHQAVSRTFYAMDLPEPSKDGEFLKFHTAESLCGLMGKPVDDTQNTLTARMLLLLESTCLPSTAIAYKTLLQRVLKTYWKNLEHINDYQPLTLVNDVVRYWRTLILNYVAKNADKEQTQEFDEADRRIRSYKLRLSRCMTCFSMLSYLLALTGSVTAVTEAHVLEAVQTKPVARLRWVADRHPGAAPKVEKLLNIYAEFLLITSENKDELKKKFEAAEFRRKRSQEGESFGDTMFELLQDLGKTERGRYLLRYMVV